MTFDKILDSGTLWTVRYDGAKDNALQVVFEQWSGPEWLVDFFSNMSDLSAYFKITDINQAIYGTIDDNHNKMSGNTVPIKKGDSPKRQISHLSDGRNRPD